MFIRTTHIATKWSSPQATKLWKLPHPYKLHYSAIVICTTINISYSLVAARSLLGETLVLSTTGCSRPREELRPRDTLFHSHLLFLQYISLLLFGFTYRWACFELKINILNSDLLTPKKRKSGDSWKKNLEILQKVVRFWFYFSLSRLKWTLFPLGGLNFTLLYLWQNRESWQVCEWIIKNFIGSSFCMAWRCTSLRVLSAEKDNSLWDLHNSWWLSFWKQNPVIATILKDHFSQEWKLYFLWSVGLIWSSCKLGK